MALVIAGYRLPELRRRKTYLDVPIQGVLIAAVGVAAVSVLLTGVLFLRRRRRKLAVAALKPRRRRQKAAASHRQLNPSSQVAFPAGSVHRLSSDLPVSPVRETSSSGDRSVGQYSQRSPKPAAP